MYKHNILDHITQIDIKNRWKRIIDQADSVVKNHVAKATTFLSPGEWSYAESVFYHYEDIQWVLEGGYQGAERKRLVIFPDYMQHDEVHPPITLLKISHKSKVRHLTHRDYLGALLSAGVERDIIGDIIVTDKMAYLFITPEMRDFIRFNLTTVGSNKVFVEDAAYLPDNTMDQGMNIVTGTVASLRVDSIISVALRLSRQKARDLVDGEKVKVNWVPVQKNVLQLKEQDMISISGYGRFKLLRIGNMSRSQRWPIEVGKLK